MHDHWAGIRVSVEAHLKESPDDVEEEVVKALVEAEFQFGVRNRSRNCNAGIGGGRRRRRPDAVERMSAVKALEELQAALAQNIEAHLAVEYACLKIEGLV